ncbi:hypothetical protein [Ideonella dechloratans]|uniref:hypothetical protein n=1 Tax=Ideonella dechloratans TaxID=36863 RepID=UPI0035AEF688
MALEAAVVVGVMALALLLRPWRALSLAGPPWPWLGWCAVMPLLWGSDQVSHVPLLQPLSGACLLALMAGWPLAMLSLLPVALLTTVLGGLDWSVGLSRLVWLGIVPASLAFGLGLAVRRWLPHHLFVYILGRGFFASVLAMWLSGALALWVQGTPSGSDAGDILIGRWLSAWGDAFLTGMLVAIFVAFRPQWLATYSDRLYLPAR